MLATVAVDNALLVTRLGALCGADATNDVIGVSTNKAAIGQQIPVRFKSAGTMICTAAVAITVDALVYKAANGKVGITNTNALVGRALEAASGDGLQLEVQPL